MSANTFKIINDQGEEIVCDILFTYEATDTHKHYIVYTDNTHDEEGNVVVYAAVFDPTLKNPKLEDIETEEEWKLIETILDSLRQNMMERAEGGTEIDMDEISAKVDRLLAERMNEEDGVISEEGNGKKLKSVVLIPFINGEEDPDLTVTLGHRIDGATSYLGYHPDYFPFISISGLHAGIQTYEDGRVYLFDMGSELGTFVNGECIGIRPDGVTDEDIMENIEMCRSESVLIKDGDMIGLSPYVNYLVRLDFND